MVKYIDTSGEAKILRKQEAMFRLSNVFLFTSLEKCFCDSIFSSDNVTWIFLGYIGVGTLLVDLYEWSSSVGFYVA